MSHFANLIGHDEIRNYLEKLISTHSIPNTLLFWGPYGVGKKTFAIKLAAQLLSNLKQDTRIDTNNHPDFHFLQPEGKTGMHSITSIRDLISQVNMAPFEAKAKLFVIDEADRMLSYSANALLKTLEEPTLDSYIILITDKIEKLLPTIISRCSKVEFSPLKEEEVNTYLTKALKKDRGGFQMMVREANGSIGKLHDLIFNEKLTLRRKLIIELLDGIFYKPYFQVSESLNKLEELLDNEEDSSIKKHQEVEEVFFMFEMWFRDLNILRMGISEKHLYFHEAVEVLKRQKIPGNFSFEKNMARLNDSKNAVERNIKIKSVLEHFLLAL